MLWPKKNSYMEFDNEKIFLWLENSPPPPPNACDNLFQLCCAHSFKSRVTPWINPFTLKI